MTCSLNMFSVILLPHSGLFLCHPRSQKPNTQRDCWKFFSGLLCVQSRWPVSLAFIMQASLPLAHDNVITGSIWNIKERLCLTEDLWVKSFHHGIYNRHGFTVLEQMHAQTHCHHLVWVFEVGIQSRSPSYAQHVMSGYLCA